MTGLPRASRPRTLRGLGSAPTSCRGAGSACRTGQEGGSRGDPPRLGRGRKGAGRAKNVRKCLFTQGRGRLPSPAPNLPPKVDRELRARTLRGCWRSPGGAGRGARFEPSGAARQAQPARVWSRDPPAPGKLLPSSPHQFPGSQTPEPSRRPEPGDSQSGGQCREVPRPLRFPETRTWKLSHRHVFARALSRKRSSVDPHPAPEKLAPLSPTIRPALPEASQGAFAAQGRVLPFFLEFMVGPGQAPTPRACPPPRFPAGPGPLGARQAGCALAPSDSGWASAPPGAAPRPVPAA